MSLISPRTPKVRPCSSVEEAAVQTKVFFAHHKYIEAFDTIEYSIKKFPLFSTSLLAMAYDLYQKVPDQSRYTLYQSRIFDFNIKEGDTVLDIGSGHIPFPLATHLADISTSDGSIGRAGQDFKHITGKKIYECSVENTPFKDKEFDFVYCSHVLEHTKYPELACQELMRIAKRGYIETPTRGKDIFLNTAKISNHINYVELINDVLTFTSYATWEQEDLSNNILLNMHIAPQTAREKAFSALLYLRPRHINTMLLWEKEFEYAVR